jgi:hypothetical protein
MLSPPGPVRWTMTGRGVSSGRIRMTSTYLPGWLSPSATSNISGSQSTGSRRVASMSATWAIGARAV